MFAGGSLTRNQMLQSRTQFYSGDGSGRDGYIFNNNGGFCPPSAPTKIEELGKSQRIIATVTDPCPSEKLLKPFLLAHIL